MKNVKKCLIIGIFLINVILTQLFVHNVFADSDTVVFADSNLEAVIREAINKPTGEILKSDVSGITSITAENKNISNISGIENLTNLNMLNLNQNKISDIGPISKLTLIEDLNLGANKIDDLSAMANLHNLKHLILSSNQILDVTPLADLSNLETLNLSYNGLGNNLNFSNMVKLTELYLDHNRIGNAELLGNVPSLCKLELGSNSLSDIKFVRKLSKLTELKLFPNFIFDYSPAKDIYNNLVDKDFNLNTVASIDISGASKLDIPIDGSVTSQYTAVVKDGQKTVLSCESVSWSLDAPVSGVLVDSETGIVSVTKDAKAESFTLKAASGSVVAKYTVTLNVILNTPAPQLTLFSWAKGSTVGTTQIKIVPQGILKYIVGAAGAKKQPKVGDVDAEYTNILEANKDIAVNDEDHIFVVKVDDGGRIIAWSDVSPSSIYINFITRTISGKICLSDKTPVGGGKIIFTIANAKENIFFTKELKEGESSKDYTVELRFYETDPIYKVICSASAGEAIASADIREVDVSNGNVSDFNINICSFVQPVYRNVSGTVSLSKGVASEGSILLLYNSYTDNINSIAGEKTSSVIIPVGKNSCSYSFNIVTYPGYPCRLELLNGNKYCWTYSLTDFSGDITGLDAKIAYEPDLSTISGKISLSDKAPVGGVSVNLLASDNKNTVGYTIKFKEGESSKDYRIYAPASIYSVSCDAVAGDTLAFSDIQQVDVRTVRNVSNVNISISPLLKKAVYRNVSGTVSLNRNCVAPKGGIELTFESYSMVDKRFVGVNNSTVIIPEGKNSCSYSFSVVTYPGYPCSVRFKDSMKCYWSKDLDDSLGDVTGLDAKITYVFKPITISGKITLSEKAPVGGASVILITTNGIHFSESTIKFNEGESSKDYCEEVQYDETATIYKVSCSVEVDDTRATSSIYQVDVTNGSVSDVNIGIGPLVKPVYCNVSGTLSLNRGVAPKGGRKLTFQSCTLINRKYEGTNNTSVTIPEGENSCSFSFKVVKYLGYPCNVYLKDGPNNIWSKLLDGNISDVTGLDIQIINEPNATISGKISLSDKAPVGGASVTLTASDNKEGHNCIVDFKEGESSKDYCVPVYSEGKGSIYTVLGTAEAGEDKAFAYTQKVDVSNGSVSNINISMSPFIQPGYYYVTGIICLPEGVVAPKGGINIIWHSKSGALTNSSTITVPEGQTSAAYNAKFQIDANEQAELSFSTNNGDMQYSFIVDETYTQKDVTLTKVLAPRITGFAWEKGNTLGTTKATVVPAGTLKYIVGAAGTKVQPNVGDSAAAYTNMLTANEDIPVTIGQHVFIVRVGNDGKITGWADIVVDAANIKPTPAPQLTGFAWTQGSTLGTTNATAVPAGTLKYIVGAAEAKIRPNMGDLDTAYANVLTANEDIPVTIGQHVFIVRVGNDGKITGWADIVVDAANIKPTPVPASQLTGFEWIQGSAVGTTKATAMPAGTLKYIVGAAGTKVQPNVGDSAAAYTNMLAAYADIPVTIGQHIFIVCVGNDGKITGWADIVVDAANIKPTPVPASQLTGFEWIQGSAVGTTKATAMPAGTLKYIVGAAGTKVQPNVGDSAAAYTNMLAAYADIPVTIGQHIFIVCVGNDGKITGWADIAVDASNIKSKSEETPVVNPPVVNPPVVNPPVVNPPVVNPPVVNPPVIAPIAGFDPNAGANKQQNKPVPQNGAITFVPVVADNTAKTEIGATDYKALFDSAAVTKGIKNLMINIDNTNSSTFSTQLPAAALTNAAKEVTTTINTAIAKVEIPSNMFNETTVKGAKNISINICKLDKSALPAAVADKIGNSPVIDISATIDGEAKTWNNPAAPVKIAIPYALKEGENSNDITVYYIDGNGNLENMQGVYNPDTKIVTFSTTHFSIYAVKANKISFDDLNGFEKYTKYIESMASKGIIEGVGNNKYSPSKVLTRAEFATLLVKMLKLDITNVTNVFTDVKASDWYAPYVNAAYNAGLISGTGAGKFAPNEVITNQDAAIILVKALKYKGAEITAESLTKVKDADTLNKYALDSVGFAVSRGIVSLDANSNFKAKSSVNRATAAEYIYNVFYFKN